MPSTPDTLLLTIALAGYRQRYRELLLTQADYARRHGYDHIVVDRPRWTIRADEAAWLKLPATLGALEAGYSVVAYLDADLRFSDTAPALESLLQPGKSVHMALGVSKRPNSGFMVFRNTAESMTFLRTVISDAGAPAPISNPTEWENTYVIHRATDNDAVAIVDQRWNNSVDRSMTDWVRHYTSGMKHDYVPPWRDRLAAWPERHALRTLKRVDTLLGDRRPPLPVRLEARSQKVVAGLSRAIVRTRAQRPSGQGSALPPRAQPTPGD